MSSHLGTKQKKSLCALKVVQGQIQRCPYPIGETTSVIQTKGMWERVPKEMQDLQEQVKTCSWAACSTRCVATLTQPVGDTHVYPLQTHTQAHAHTYKHVYCVRIKPYCLLRSTAFTTSTKKKKSTRDFFNQKKETFKSKRTWGSYFPFFPLFFPHLCYVIWTLGDLMV